MHGCFDLVLQRRIEHIAAEERRRDRHSAVRLNSSRDRPQNFRRIVNVNVVVEDENILGMIKGQRRGSARGPDRPLTFFSSR